MLNTWKGILQKRRNSELTKRTALDQARAEGDGAPIASSSILEFEPETCAEQFHAYREGKEARGTFLKLDPIQVKDSGPEWDVGHLGPELESESVSALEKRSSSRRSSTGRRRSVRKSETSTVILPAAIKRVGTVAAAMGWISPKSHAAIDVIKAGERKLSRSEANALRFLLERCETLSAYRPDVRAIRRMLDGDSEV